MNISGTQRQLGFATPEGSVHLPMQQHKKCVGRQEHQDLLRVSIAQLLPSAPVGPALVLTHQRYTMQKHKRSAAHLIQALSTDDAAEIGLRRISAWLHEKGTGDKAAARSMLAVQPRGQYANAATRWLLEQSQFLSQAESMTQERVTAAGGPGNEGRDPKGTSKGQQKGEKGRGGKEKKGHAEIAAAPPGACRT